MHILHKTSGILTAPVGGHLLRTETPPSEENKEEKLEVTSSGVVLSAAQK